MTPFSVSWGYGLLGKDLQSGSKREVAWGEVEPMLERLMDVPGSITVEGGTDSGSTPRSLEVQGENGNYLLTLGEEDEDGWNTRSFTNPDGKSKPQVEIGGYLWSATLVCHDLDIVKRAFQEFLETGNVSTDLLD